MTILFLTRRFYPQVGGVETHLLKITERLILKGYNIIIVAESLDKDDEKNLKGSDLKWQNWYKSAKVMGEVDWIVKSTKNRLIPLPEEMRLSEQKTAGKFNNEFKKIIILRLPKVNDGRLKKIYIWLWFWKNRYLFRMSDIVHCHDVFFWYLPFRFLFPRKPVYTTFHGYESYPIPKKNVLIRKLSEKLSWGNICVGDFIKKWYGTKPDIVSYGGVDTSPVTNKAQKPSAVFIGRLEENTGIDIYIKTVEKIKKKYPEFKFTVIGSGKLRIKIEKYTKINELMPNNKIIDEIKTHQFVFSSGYLTILEAFAAKRIVFAVYDNELKKDYLKNTPFSRWVQIVNTENELYNKIDHALSQPHFYAKQLEEAYSWVKTQTWDEVAKSYEYLWLGN